MNQCEVSEQFEITEPGSYALVKQGEYYYIIRMDSEYLGKVVTHGLTLEDNDWYGIDRGDAN